LLKESPEAFTKYAPRRATANLKKILETFSSGKPRYKLFDCRNLETFADLVKTTLGSGATLLDFSDYIIRECSGNSPVMFHFDELGIFPADDLRQLRNACLRALASFDDERLKESPPFFFFSGREAAYNELGSLVSPIGSHWLILEPMETDHVLKIIADSTTLDTMDEPAFPFVRSLDDQHRHRLAETIIKWTAGAPRPLLYALHMLELSAKDFGDLYKSEQVLRQMFGLIVDYVKRDPELVTELGPVAPRCKELSRDEEMAYDYLCLLSWLGKSVDVESELNHLEKQLETYEVLTSLLIVMIIMMIQVSSW